MQRCAHSTVMTVPISNSKAASGVVRTHVRTSVRGRTLRLRPSRTPVRALRLLPSYVSGVTGIAFALVIAAASCKGNPTPILHAANGEAPPAGGVAPANAPAPGDWPLPGRDAQGTRYSPLTQITADNVKDLRVAWTFSTGYARGFEGQPLVVDNTMYVVSPYPNTVFALDLTKKGGPVKWVYKPPTAPASQGEACCDVVNRGASYADGKVVFNRLDDHTVAIDAATGKTAWDTQLDSIQEGATMTMAPLIVGRVVLVGNSGAELGVHGWIAGLDLASGKVLWRAYNTGPTPSCGSDPRLNHSIHSTRVRIWGCRRGRPTSGNSAEARFGDGSRTTRS